MKKLIIAAAIALVATISQAAAVGWNCAGATDFKGGDYSVFVIGLNGVTSVAQIEALVEAGGLGSVDSYAFYSGGTVNASNGSAILAAANSGKSITFKPKAEEESDEQWKAKNTYQAFLFVEDSKGEKASYTATVSTTLENDNTAKTLGFSNQATNFANNTFTVNTPEPTSGVLLLLGMAGLALKRKRA